MLGESLTTLTKTQQAWAMAIGILIVVVAILAGTIPKDGAS